MPSPVLGAIGGTGAVDGIVDGFTGSNATLPVSQELQDLVGQIQSSSGSVAGAVGQSADIQIQAAQDALAASLGGNAQAQSILGSFFGQSNAELQRGTNAAIGLQQPLIAAGDNGLDILNNLGADVTAGAFDPGEFQFNFDENDPGFQFLVDRGNSAVNAGSNASGLLNSGGRLKELATFNQGVANSFKTDELNRQASVFDRNATRLNNQFTQANTIGSVLGNIGVNARNNTGQLETSLSQALASNLNAFGAQSAGLATSAANAQASLIDRIAALQGGSLVDQAQINDAGLLSQINALSSLESIERGNLATQNAANQQAAGNVLGLIGSATGALI